MLFEIAPSKSMDMLRTMLNQLVDDPYKGSKMLAKIQTAQLDK